MKKDKNILKSAVKSAVRFLWRSLFRPVFKLLPESRLKGRLMRAGYKNRKKAVVGVCAACTVSNV